MTEDYWKKPDPQESGTQHKDPGVGIWSRWRALRIVAWVFALTAACVAALFASAYLSGFSSVIDMINWLRTSP
jgi:hypothetical protein